MDLATGTFPNEYHGKFDVVILEHPATTALTKKLFQNVCAVLKNNGIFISNKLIYASKDQFSKTGTLRRHGETLTYYYVKGENLPILMFLFSETLNKEMLKEMPKGQKAVSFITVQDGENKFTLPLELIIKKLGKNPSKWNKAKENFVKKKIKEYSNGCLENIALVKRNDGNIKKYWVHQGTKDKIFIYATKKVQ